MFYFLFFFFGASIGSFVQVVATRLHVAPIIKSRSKCLSCGEALRAFDLIPFFSYLFLGGKCRYCDSKYGISALVIESLYGLTFVALYHFILSQQVSIFISSLWLLYYSLLLITFGVIALYDRVHTYIPLSFLFSYCFLTLIILVIRFINDPSSATLLSPVIVALPFLMVWLVTKGKGIGFGDVLLFLGIGAFFGIAQGLAVLFVSVWIGAIVGIVIYLMRRKNNIKNTTIPFVPFILIAFLIVLFTDIDIFSIAHIFAW